MWLEAAATRAKAPAVSTTEDREDKIARLYRDAEITVADLAARFGISRAKIYVILEKKGVNRRTKRMGLYQATSGDIYGIWRQPRRRGAWRPQ